MIARMAMLALALFTVEAGASDLDRVYLMGIGRSSCASWLADPASEAEGSAWLLGFWTGANYYSETHVVGGSTDALGVIATVKKRCAESPADSLIAVASRTFNEFAKQGR